MKKVESEIWNFVVNFFALMEYEIKYNLTPEECAKRHFIHFDESSKSYYTDGRSKSYCGFETAEILGISSMFEAGNKLREEFEGRAGIKLVPAESISQVVERIYLNRRAKVLQSVREQIAGWDLVRDELFPSTGSIH